MSSAHWAVCITLHEPVGSTLLVENVLIFGAGQGEHSIIIFVVEKTYAAGLVVQTDSLIILTYGLKSTRDWLSKFSLLYNLVVKNLLDLLIMLSLSDTMLLLELELLFAH